jgi:hypothetical protein
MQIGFMWLRLGLVVTYENNNEPLGSIKGMEFVD